jgi:hypothetical protein
MRQLKFQHATTITTTVKHLNHMARRNLPSRISGAAGEASAEEEEEVAPFKQLPVSSTVLPCSQVPNKISKSSKSSSCSINFLKKEEC